MDICCPTMREQLAKTCDRHDRYACPDQIVHRWPDGRVGLHIKDGGTAMIVIDYCPWCGTDISVSDDEIDRYGAAKQSEGEA